MRFHFGAVPEDAAFDPQAEGWRGIREPSPLAINFLALPVGIVLALFTFLLLWLVFPKDMLYNRVERLDFPGWLLALMFILIIPVHELLHAVYFPGHGLTNRTVIGCWASRLLFYASYDGPMSRNRFLVVFLSPYLYLSLLPVALIAVLRLVVAPLEVFVFLAVFSLISGVLACGDIIGFALVLAQIPKQASVRNKGWKTYWKEN